LSTCKNEGTVDHHNGSALKLGNNSGYNQHNGWLVDLTQGLPMYGSKHKQRWRRVKKESRLGVPNPGCVYSTLPLLVCVYSIGITRMSGSTTSDSVISESRYTEVFYFVT